MAESVVSFVVERIGDLLIQEGKFLAGVSGQVRQLQDELRRMQCFLEDVDNRQDENKSVLGWVSDIRELAYDAENVIETFALLVASRRENGFRNKCKRYATIFIEGAHVHRVGIEIEAIQARIIEITRSLTTYGIQIKKEAGGSTSIQQKLKRSYSHVIEEHTFGQDNDVKVLLKRLLDEETCVGHIVSICGMGGLGKTTLAKKLYHLVSVRDHFDAFAWYCVSQQFQPRQVWEGILVKLASSSNNRRDEISKMNDDEIAKELYLLQQKRKCLVVLDDIWTTDAWDLLKPAFPIIKAVGGTKIMLTTRNKTIASHADGRAFIHELQTLNEHDSWELFQTKAFLNNNNSGPDFNIYIKNLGMEIVKKCGGLPMVIAVLGGLLATKNSPSEWEKVHKNVNSYLSGKMTNQEYSFVHGVLALSYNELPYHLKPCFLHLGNFPEDYDILCTTLFRMWVAEGFVSHCQYGEIMEDVSERYLRELVNRSMVQVSRMGSVGRVKTCRLHDLMREFCLPKANEENYLQIVCVTNSNEKLNSNKVRRLAVDRDGASNFDLGNYVKTPNLRSFLLFMDYYYLNIKSCFTDFKFLKILSLEKCRIGKQMRKEIGDLIHLRYLSIKDCQIEALPSSIGNLRYLQTLIIRLKYIPVAKLSNVIWKLEQLRHLVLKNCCIGFFSRESLKLGNMRELQTLQCDESYFNISDFDGLVNSSNLTKLGLKISLGVDKIPSVILSRLRSLSIRPKTTDRGSLKMSNQEELEIFFSRCPQLLKLCFNGRIEKKLPECQHFPQNLVKLTLDECFLDEDPMPILEKLPNLRILRLRWEFRGSFLVCSSKGFPKLETLLLQTLDNLEEWRVDEEAMPNLSLLHIANCPALKMIPEGIKFITTLRQLVITSMPNFFEDRVRNEDCYKVRHVPSIIFNKSRYHASSLTFLINFYL